MLAGLVFYDPQPRDASHAESSLGLLFFLQLAWALLPFSTPFLSDANMSLLAVVSCELHVG